jgi:hypothetical protein
MSTLCEIPQMNAATLTTNKPAMESAETQASNVITIAVPQEWAEYDQQTIQAILEATLPKESRFGINRVIVRTPGVEEPSAIGIPGIWDKYC